MIKKIITTLIFLISSSLSSIIFSQTAEYKKISPQEAYTFMQTTNAIILDVRTLQEYQDGHIQNAILIPNESINSKTISTLPNKDSLILVYCRSGSRSAESAKKLIKLGYTNVLDFGGIIDWPYSIIK